MKIINDLDGLLVNKEIRLEEILEKMNRGHERVLLVVNNGVLLGLITDGDIRREIVTNGTKSNATAEKIMSNNPKTSLDKPHLWEEVFLNNDIEHLPIVDAENKVIKIIRNIKNYENFSIPNTVGLIIAGGMGTRMGKEFQNLPKCLIKVKNKTILQRTLEKLETLGLEKIIVSLNHEYEKIIKEIENSKYNNFVEFYIEEEPLGTAGSLVKLSNLNKDYNFLVFNSDIIFDLDFLKMKNYIDENDNDVFICTAQHEVEIPYGVIEKEIQIRDKFKVVEKPRLKFDVIAGIYYFSANSINNDTNSVIEMDQLLEKLELDNKKLVYYDIGSNWIDIGNENQLNIAENLLFIR